MNTKKMIIHAMMKLTSSTSIEKITVERILKESGVSRATFYKYFTDKYAAMTAYYQVFSAQQRNRAHGKTVLQDLTNACKYAKQNRAYFVHLQRTRIQGHEKGLYWETIYPNTVSYNAATYQQHHQKTELSETDLRYISFFSAGCVNMISCWIEAGCTHPPEVIAQEIHTLYPDDLKGY